MTELTGTTWQRRLSLGATHAPAMLLALVFGMTMPWNRGSFAG